MSCIKGNLRTVAKDFIHQIKAIKEGDNFAMWDVDDVGNWDSMLSNILEIAEELKLDLNIENELNELDELDEL